MKIAVISDIHGNWEAFDRVLDDIAADASIDEVFCLGDNIGYGPDPEIVVTAIVERGIPSVIGNHELAAADAAYLSWFNPKARVSLQHSIERMSPESIAYVSALEPFIVAHGCRFVHGFPPDSPLLYVFQVSQDRLYRTLADAPEPICFVGHTHDLEIIDFDGTGIRTAPLTRGMHTLKPDHHYIINVGSVGQPRDGNNNAKYAVWDADRSQLEIRFVTYDIDAVVRKIFAAGLPKYHALRLY
jgi:predicted phosphodiesterase